MASPSPSDRRAGRGVDPSVESRGADPKGSDSKSSEARAGRSSASRSRLGALLQRLFYPDEFQREQLVLDLIEDLARCRDIPELAQDVGQGLEQALQPNALHVFVRHEHRFRLVWSTDRPLEPMILVPAGLRILAEASSWSEPRAVSSLPEASAEDRQWLRSFGATWLVPMIVTHSDPDAIPRLVGLLLLGARGEGLGAVQRDLLHTLASRMAAHVSALVEQDRRRLLAEQGRGSWLKECPNCSRCFESTVCFCPEDDHVLEPTILLDRLVVGRYLIERKVGSGGMGAVYRAQDQETDKPVALKVLTSGDRIALGRFENEAQAGKVIRHPNITRVLDSGRLGRQGAFMVMEYVEGRTLRQVMDAEMPIHPARAARWFDQILSGVAAAHGHGVIHRDLKPDNIMIVGGGEEETLKVLDFGLAKLAAATDGAHPALTAVGMVIGTLSYMSPEQLAAEPIDHRTDQFALGAMIAEALTGELPFYAENLGKMLRAVANEPFRMEVETVAQARVADVLGRALAKTPADRYAEIEAFRRDLVPALEACEPFSGSRGAARA